MKEPTYNHLRAQMDGSSIIEELKEANDGYCRTCAARHRDELPEVPRG